MVQSMKDKLAGLVSETNLKHLEDLATFFKESTTPKEFLRAMGKSEKSWGAGYHQMVAPLFFELYKKETPIREEVCNILGELGVNEELVTEYFAKYSDLGGIGTRLLFKNQNMSEEVQNQFTKLTENLMLEKIRGYLELS